MVLAMEMLQEAIWVCKGMDRHVPRRGATDKKNILVPLNPC